MKGMKEWNKLRIDKIVGYQADSSKPLEVDGEIDDRINEGISSEKNVLTIDMKDVVHYAVATLDRLLNVKGVTFDYAKCTLETAIELLEIRERYDMYWSEQKKGGVV